MRCVLPRGNSGAKKKSVASGVRDHVESGLDDICCGWLHFHVTKLTWDIEDSKKDGFCAACLETKARKKKARRS